MSDPEGGEVRSVSSTGGEKGTKLARFDLIPAGPLWKIAEHYGIGAGKYEDRNWEKGYEWSKSYAALSRHLNAWWGGEDLDPEFGDSHMTAVAWHAIALLEYLETHPEFDDRPTTQRRREEAGIARTEESGPFEHDETDCRFCITLAEKRDADERSLTIERLDDEQMVRTYIPRAKYESESDGFGFTKVQITPLPAHEIPLAVETQVAWVDQQGFLAEGRIDSVQQMPRTSEDEAIWYSYFVVHENGLAGIRKYRHELYVKA